ncbi:MAG: hypothetical protein KJ645_08550 [Planctomycetes bacterium]|nr:hypothetical protein [Planctomycetota bacterium]
MKKNIKQEDAPMKRNTIDELKLFKGGFVGYLRDRSFRSDIPPGPLGETVDEKTVPSNRSIFEPLTRKERIIEAVSERRTGKIVPVFIPSVEAKLRALSGIAEPETAVDPEIEAEAEAETEAEVEEEIETEIGPEAEVETEPETESGVDEEIEAAVKPEIDAEIEAEVEQEVEAAEKPEPDSAEESSPETLSSETSSRPDDSLTFLNAMTSTQYLICKVCGTIINVLNAERNARCCRQLMIPLSKASDDASSMQG